MNSATATTSRAQPPPRAVASVALQRRCACGAAAGAKSECDDCQRDRLLGRPLRRKLAIGTADDPYEREADRVADQVLRTSDAALGAPASSVSLSPLVQRSARSADAALGEAPSLVHDVLASAGQPLDSRTLAYFEPRFQYDFGRVRVHTDARAAESARQVNALAYTVGEHVVFGAGSATVGAGNALVAHELSHVVQQMGGTPAARGPVFTPGEGVVQRFPASLDDARTAAARVALNALGEWDEETVIGGIERALGLPGVSFVLRAHPMLAAHGATLDMFSSTPGALRALWNYARDPDAYKQRIKDYLRPHAARGQQLAVAQGDAVLAGFGVSAESRAAIGGFLAPVAGYALAAFDLIINDIVLDTLLFWELGSERDIFSEAWGKYRSGAIDTVDLIAEHLEILVSIAGRAADILSLLLMLGGGATGGATGGVVGSVVPGAGNAAGAGGGSAAGGGAGFAAAEVLGAIALIGPAALENFELVKAGIDLAVRQQDEEQRQQDLAQISASVTALLMMAALAFLPGLALRVGKSLGRKILQLLPEPSRLLGKARAVVEGVAGMAGATRRTAAPTVVDPSVLVRDPASTDLVFIGEGATRSEAGSLVPSSTASPASPPAVPLLSADVLDAEHVPPRPPANPMVPARAPVPPAPPLAELASGHGLSGRPPPEAVREAQLAIGRGTESASERERLLLESALDGRDLISAESKKSTGLPATAATMTGACGLGRDCSVASFAALVRKSARPVRLLRYRAVDLADGAVAGHNFAVVKFADGATYILDPTFAQFWHAAGEGAGAELAAELMRGGFVQLNEAVAREYGMILARAARGGQAPLDPDLFAHRLMNEPGRAVLVEEIGSDAAPGVVYSMPDSKALPEITDREELLAISLDARAGALRRGDDEDLVRRLEGFINRVEDRGLPAEELGDANARVQVIARPENATSPEPGRGAPVVLRGAELDAAVERTAGKGSADLNVAEQAIEAAWVDAHPEAIEPGSARARVAGGEHEIERVGDVCKRHSHGPVRVVCPISLPDVFGEAPSATPARQATSWAPKVWDQLVELHEQLDKSLRSLGGTLENDILLKGDNSEIEKLKAFSEDCRARGRADDKALVDDVIQLLPHVWTALNDADAIAWAVIELEIEKRSNAGSGDLAYDYLQATLSLMTAMRREIIQVPREGGVVQSSREFFDKYGGTDKAILDLGVLAKKKDQKDAVHHGAISHIIQDRVVDQALSRIVVNRRMTSGEFRLLLRRVSDLVAAQSPHDPRAMTSKGSDLWESTYDANGGQLANPNWFWRVIRDKLRIPEGEL